MPGDDSGARSEDTKENRQNGLFGGAEGWELIYKVAGAAGVDPRPYTIREIFWLYEGYDRQSWMYTAATNAMQSAAAGAKNSSIEKFHPYMQTQKIKSQREKLLEIKRRQDVKNSSKDG
jgi:hypothetical protein